MKDAYLEQLACIVFFLGGAMILMFLIGVLASIPMYCEDLSIDWCSSTYPEELES